MSWPRGFRRVAAAGISFQAGSAAVDSATITAALIFQLSGSSVLVGAVTAILRFGWLSPQLFVGFLAQNSARSLPYYMIGAFGRAACIALIALLLWVGRGWSGASLTAVVMGLWTAYAFVSGIVAVPYNDIVARSVAPNARSRLLAVRFFGGGVLALAVAWAADAMVGALAFPAAYAAIFAMAAGLMLVSSLIFTSIGEPEGERRAATQTSFASYLAQGGRVYREDARFRRFLQAQWLGAVVLMALPFFVVLAARSGLPFQHVPLLLASQTAGALASNMIWGWWGDRLGKASLMRGIAALRLLPPLAALAILWAGAMAVAVALPVWIAVFAVLGALSNGLTIAVIGLLMEISPDDRRPAYSGYFNALTAPAFLLPLLGGVLAETAGMIVLFTLSALAAAGQFLLLRGLGGD